MHLENTLRTYWGYDRFRPLQKEIIQAVLAKKDVLALLPTGGGKSICFQLPALLQTGLTLVISPLISLMQDQVNQLKKRHIEAEALYAGLSRQETNRILDQVVQNQLKLLYLSPERLQTTAIVDRLAYLDLSLLVIDEAHCISQWGYDFRPAYLEITRLKASVGALPTIALTATATPSVQLDIQKKLAMKEAAIFRKSFARENLVYVVRKSDNKIQMLRAILSKVPGTAIVYVQTRSAAEHIAEFLQKHHMSADYYHAGLDQAERTAKQEAWIREEKRIIVATNAFGMGIDKPNVRLVVHMAPSSSLEGYYQEAGRAGRDQKRAYAVLLYTKQDLRNIHRQVKRTSMSAQEIKHYYQNLANYYKIVVGSLTNISYPFDIEHFAATCHGAIPKVKAAIHALKHARLIDVSDYSTQPASVRLLLRGSELYNFQVANPGAQPILQQLIYLYGPILFRHAYPVSLERIASRVAMTPQLLKKALRKLERLEVLAYIPSKQLPQLTFLTRRPSIGSLSIEVKTQEKRTKIRSKQANAVIYYATHARRCRSQMLCEYFGEITTAPCKTCDMCRLHRNKSSKKHRTTLSVQPILRMLAHQPMSIHELIESIGIEHIEDIQTTLQRLLKTQQLAYNDHMQLIPV